MNHISLFLSRPEGLGSPAAPDRRPVGEGESPKLESPREEADDFAAMFGDVLSRPLSSEDQKLLKEFGVDPRLEGALREAGLGSDALRVLRELGLDEEGLTAMKGAGEIDTVRTGFDDVSRELEQRVERVQDRMFAEFGHKVRVVETYRSQERQLELYAQGRTQPGRIVTWTERSAHTEGLAVDVIIDGGYDNEQAFERLQRIAREEGLRTLGANDRGHLELDRAAAEVVSGRPGGRLAVAAAVARVAAPARIATPGDLGSAPEAPRLDIPKEFPSGDLPRPPLVEVRPPHIRGMESAAETVQSEAPQPAPGQESRPGTGQESRTEGAAGRGPAELAAGTSQRGSAESGHESKQESRSGRGDADRLREVSASPEPIAAPATEDAPEKGFRKEPTAVSSTPAVTGTAGPRGESTLARGEAAEVISGTDALDRISHIRDLQLDGRTHRVSRLVLDIPDGVDSIGKLDISARGDLINARIEANQPSLADQLRAHVVELKQGLVGRGLRPEVLQVRDPQVLDAIRLAGAAGGSTAGADVSAARSEAGRGSSGDAGPNRDNHSGEFDRNHTRDARSNDGRSARREDGRRGR